MLKVRINDKNSGRYLVEYPVEAIVVGEASSKEEYFRLAYTCLVEDGRADGKSYEQLQFSFVS